MREAATSGLTVRSSAVNTAMTPAAARAAAQSIETMRACACSLRRNATCSTFAACRSSTKLPRPVSSRGSSVRFTRAPMIFGLASMTSLIGVGTLAQPLPLRIVVAADHGRALPLDAPYLLPRFQQRVRVPCVARRDITIECRAQAHRVGSKQETPVAIERDQRAHRALRVAG